jgi:protein-tyrosine phosphatase
VIDIHCHCLPALDDGPATLADSVLLCEALVADGVHTVVATPHQLGRYTGLTEPATVHGAIETLRAQLKSRSIPLELIAGGDVRIHEDLVALISSNKVLTLADARHYLLLEMPHEVFIDASRLIQTLADQGIRVILTHPERYHWLRHHIARILTWRNEHGVLLQVTAASLLGDFGPGVETIAWKLAEKGLIDMVASDAHAATGSRRPRMSAARDLVTQRLGQPFATDWFQTIPAKVIADPLPL